MNKKSTQRFIAIIQIAFLMATNFLGMGIAVDSSIERAQYYAGSCISIDSTCRASHGKAGVEISFAENESHSLNLMLHIFGAFDAQERMTSVPVATSIWNPVVPALLLWLHPILIFHPPRV